MSVVTISRQYGAGGSSVAGIVASELGAEVVDKRLIEEVASRLAIRTSDVEAEDEKPRTLMERLVRSFSTLEPGMGAGWTPPYPDPLFDPRKEIIHLTEAVKVTEEELEKLLTKAGAESWKELTIAQADKTIKWLRGRIA